MTNSPGSTNTRMTGKQRVLTVLDDLASGDPRTALDRHCEADAIWDVFHPFDRLLGPQAAAQRFWAPLSAAFFDWEFRPGLALEGEYEGAEWVSVLGHVQGVFARPWLGIPPTAGLVRLRLGINARLRAGRIAHAYVLLDVVDVMRQAGFDPFRRAPGSPELWPDPPLDSGVDLVGTDPERGARTLQVVREMQAGLGEGDTVEDHARNAEHSSHWHPQMNWYGMTGIGSTRAQRGFDDFHGAPFIEAFPDRGGWDERSGRGDPDEPGHYIQLGDGAFGVTGGWPSLHGTHTGGSWLGLGPTGRPVTMRVADWYRLDADDRIVDNWVMIDVLDILAQEGFDVLADLSHRIPGVVPRLHDHISPRNGSETA